MAGPAERKSMEERKKMEDQLREQLWSASRKSYRIQALHIHSCTCFASQVVGFFNA